MRAFVYLNKLKQMDIKIKNNIEELQSLQILKNKVAPALCGGDVQDCRSPEQAFKCMAKIEKVKEALDAEIVACLEYKKQARTLVCESCDSECSKLLYFRYFRFMTWRAISEVMGYCCQWVEGPLHRKALAQLQDAMERQKIMF